MESKKSEWPEEALSLRLLRTFLSLQPENRKLVFDLVERLAREQDRRGEGAETRSP